MYQNSPHFRTDALEGAASQQAATSPEAALKTAVVGSKKKSGKVFEVSPRTNTLLGVQIVATGSYVPERVVTNEELERKYGFEPGWIEQRSGILERRHAPAHQATSDLCVEAAKQAIRAARIDPDQIDLLIVGTFTPDTTIPSTACLVQEQLGLDVPAFDLSAACSGFIYSLVTAAQYVATGNSKMALVIGGDLLSRVVNPWDQRSSPLFGDGAGAVLLTRGNPHQGFACYQTGSDGSGGPLLVVPAGGTRRPMTAEDLTNGDRFLQMEGRSVFKWAVRALTDTIDHVLQKSGMTPQDVSLFALHQANIRIINYAAEQLGIPPEKMFNNLHKYGNTSAASVPIVLDEAFRAGRINRGDSLLMSGFGAGLTWGTALFRW